MATKKPATAKVASAGVNEIVIPALDMRTASVRVIGHTPLYMNRMSEKAKHSPLVGGGRKTAAQKLEIKHDPFREFRDSAQRHRSTDGKTALGIKAVSFKAAMATAALLVPGVKKTDAQRLLFMPGDTVPCWGVPALKLDVVRSADMNKTPDVRSRAYLARWCAEIEFQYVVPNLSYQGVLTLLANAGKVVGVGDYRQEKGKGNYGLFRILGDGQKDDEWDEIVASGGFDAQVAALEAPEFADEETEELMAFYGQEVNRRRAA